MATTMILDEDLPAVVDVVTVRVSTPDAPTDIWSLTDAVNWMMRQLDRSKSFFPPACPGRARGLGAA